MDCFKNFGLAIFSPVDKIAKSLMPKSTPIAFPFAGGVIIPCGVSTSIDAKYLLVGVLEIVTVFISPSNFWEIRIGISDILGIVRVEFSQFISLLPLWHLKEF